MDRSRLPRLLYCNDVSLTRSPHLLVMVIRRMMRMRPGVINIRGTSSTFLTRGTFLDNRTRQRLIITDDREVEENNQPAFYSPHPRIYIIIRRCSFYTFHFPLTAVFFLPLFSSTLGLPVPRRVFELIQFPHDGGWTMTFPNVIRLD